MSDLKDVHADDIARMTAEIAALRDQLRRATDELTTFLRRPRVVEVPPGADGAQDVVGRACSTRNSPYVRPAVPTAPAPPAPWSTSVVGGDLRRGTALAPGTAAVDAAAVWPADDGEGGGSDGGDEDASLVHGGRGPVWSSPGRPRSPAPDLPNRSPSRPRSAAGTTASSAGPSVGANRGRLETVVIPGDLPADPAASGSSNNTTTNNKNNTTLLEQAFTLFDFVSPSM